MFTTTKLRRSLAVCTSAAALLPAGMVPAANAAPIAQEQYYESQTITPSPAEERYYSSYGESEPLRTPASGGDGDTPWLPVTLALASGLVIAGATGAQVRRLRIRRRRAVGAAT